LFPQADNSVLAARVMAQSDRPVIWDEFYHGLTVRGNPLFLLTRSGYALVATAILAIVLVWVWRQAIFLGPPVAPATAPRRTLAEYIDAMANFPHLGAGSLHFMLSEFRHGVLSSLRRRLGLHRGQESAEDIATALGRHDPEAARQFRDAVAAVDLILSQKSRAARRD